MQYGSFDRPPPNGNKVCKRATHVQSATFMKVSGKQTSGYGVDKLLKEEDKTYVEDLESGDVEHTDEELALVLGVECLVDTLDQPLEHAVVQGLGQGSHRVHDLHTSPMDTRQQWAHVSNVLHFMINWSRHQATVSEKQPGIIQGRLRKVVF